jgi:ribose 5-phosphate isomerase B
VIQANLSAPDRQAKVREEEVRQRVREVVDEVLGVQTAASSESTSESSPDAVSADIAIGADHGGTVLKATLIQHLRAKGYRVHDCGAQGSTSVDYPDYAARVARLVSSGSCSTGIMIDGAGIGSCMAANKVPGVRAALCYDISSARNSREHNHANLLTLGAGLIGEGLAKQIVDAWLDTEWGGGRHARRVAGIMALESISGPKDKAS